MPPFAPDIERALEVSNAALAAEREFQQLRSRYDALGRRAQEVMALVVTALMNKQIAYELGLSEVTVKCHRGNATRKMNAQSIVDLVAMASKLRFLHKPIATASTTCSVAS